jgi:hypothetical protein
MKTPAVALEKTESEDSPPVKSEAEGCPQNAEPVSHRSAEIDRRSLCEVLRRARDLHDYVRPAKRLRRDSYTISRANCSDGRRQETTRRYPGAAPLT